MGVKSAVVVAAAATLVAALFMGGREFKSVTSQSLHYFSRPHSGQSCVAPLRNAAAWVAADMPPEVWRITLSSSTVAAFDTAIAAVEVRHQNSSLYDALRGLTPSSFPLPPDVVTEIKTWSSALAGPCLSAWLQCGHHNCHVCDH
jgi:hypothetical protein